MPKVLPSSGIIGTTLDPISDFRSFLNSLTNTIVVETNCPSLVPSSNSEKVVLSGASMSIIGDFLDGKYPPSSLFFLRCNQFPPSHLGWKNGLFQVIRHLLVVAENLDRP